MYVYNCIYIYIYLFIEWWARTHAVYIEVPWAPLEAPFGAPVVG